MVFVLDELKNRRWNRSFFNVAFIIMFFSVAYWRFVGVLWTKQDKTGSWVLKYCLFVRIVYNVWIDGRILNGTFGSWICERCKYILRVYINVCDRISFKVSCNILASLYIFFQMPKFSFYDTFLLSNTLCPSNVFVKLIVLIMMFLLQYFNL